LKAVLEWLPVLNMISKYPVMWPCQFYDQDSVDEIEVK